MRQSVTEYVKGYNKCSLKRDVLSFARAYCSASTVVRTSTKSSILPPPLIESTLPLLLSAPLACGGVTVVDHDETPRKR